MSDLKQIDSVAGIKIYSVAGEPPSFVFKAEFTVDADGSPNCYGPGNAGLDWTDNGGTPGGNWWGGPTDAQGYPCIQKVYDPTPGFYVSGTSLINPAFPEDSPYRYTDSESIPFFVLPGGSSNGAKLGDVGLVLNTVTGDNCYAVYADNGPTDHIGEGSIRLAEALSLDPDPKAGGADSPIIVYLVFPGSVGGWKPPSVWFDVANTLTHAWGGLSKLKQIAKDL
jgi:Fungal chitosanase of glycosyl hydrolase group 75